MNIRQILLLILFTPLCVCTFAQNEIINLHSISTNRQPSGDSGYTLNGQRMNNHSREKLLNPVNFGDSGTYPKSIVITDNYILTDDLIDVGSQDIDLFYFGTFNKLEASLATFSEAEIDSLYEWSIRGGKLIIAASAPYSGIDYNPSILNSKWGFSPSLIEGTVFCLPAIESQVTPLFDGPFGQVSSANQGGAAQGFFDDFPADAVVLSVNQFDQPVIYLDCETLDLIVADGDMYTDIGNISLGNVIITDNDRLWANTIAFMDELQTPPYINSNGNTLSVGTYESYQWFLNGNPIGGATSQIYTITESGNYYIEVVLSGGCVKSSPVLSLHLTDLDANSFNVPIEIYPNPVHEEIVLNFELISKTILDIQINNHLGQNVKNLVQKTTFNGGIHSLNFSISDLPNGVYYLSIRTSKGDLAKKFIKMGL